jgi:hypothetical protein
VNKPRADRLKICDDTLPPPAAPLQAAAGDDAPALRARLSEVVAELSAARHALWQREAELAAGVPVTARGDETPHLAERLQAVLQGGAEAIECHAAALYLLDEATSHLKLRSTWGLSPKKLTDPPRPLAGAVADLEALLGHAVVLTDPKLAESWNAPESLPAALCVPVASPTIPLGTLWFFARQPREFSDCQTNLAEIIAGRVAADLDRAALLNEAAANEPTRRLLRELESWRQDHARRTFPNVDGWRFTRVDQVGADSGKIIDILAVGRRRVAALVATVQTTPLSAEIAATALRIAFAALAGGTTAADRLLRRLNRAFCRAFPGDIEAEAALLLVEARTGRYRFAAAGQFTSAPLRITNRTGQVQPVPALKPSPLLGRCPDADYRQADGLLEVRHAMTLGHAVRLYRDAAPHPA